MFNEIDAIKIANKLGIVFNRFTLKDFIVGLNIELEHGLISPETNVTYNDPILTAKIALAHLNEFSDYYNNDYGLPAMERLLQEKSIFK